MLVIGENVRGITLINFFCFCSSVRHHFNFKKKIDTNEINWKGSITCENCQKGQFLLIL